jgi:hypothetical protein
VRGMQVRGGERGADALRWLQPWVSLLLPLPHPLECARQQLVLRRLPLPVILLLHVLTTPRHE